MTPTPEQKLAIEKSGNNIIVSAGAGSGKTAVLSERVLQKVLHGTSIDRLLVLTFTNAAASEMKDRIRAKIKENKLTSQLNKIDNSYITTFDSFSLSLVKKYHYLLNIKKDVNILEGNVLKVKTKEYLDMVLEDKYQEQDTNFVQLVSDLCVKDDDNLRKAIIDLNDKLNLRYDKQEYLQNYMKNFFQEDVFDNLINQYEKLLQVKIHDVDLILNKLANYTDADYFSKVLSLSESLLNSHDYISIRTSLLNYKLPNIPKGSDEEAKNIKKELADLVKELKNLTRFENNEDLKKSLLLMKPYMSAMIDIIMKLDNKLNTYKYQNDLYDFIDISKMAIKIVKENKNIQEEIKHFFEEIMVDEYQDTSDLQEEFINLISNHNLYMVGDVKQSIYRFRNANPHIFRHKYNDYAEDKDGIKIDLLKNFRSREEVLNNINLLFDFVMSDEMGGADYIHAHRMVFGNNVYREETINQNNNFEVYSYSYEKNNQFSKEEIEAFIIAHDIKEKVANHFQVLDGKTKKLRDVTYDDFCILIDRSGSFDLFKKVFVYEKLPVSIRKDEYLTNSSLFFVIKSIFSLLTIWQDKPCKEEIAFYFLSIGRSFLFSYDDEYLFKVVTNNLYEETEILTKIKKILLNIDSKTISQILDEIIIEFNFYEKLRIIPSLTDNYTKIDYLYTLSETLNTMGYTYQDFVTFIDNLFADEEEIKFPINEENSGSIKIMTIHKSKGLEYPICYFPCLYKQFNMRDASEKINYSNELGFILPYYDDGIASNFLYELYKKNYYNEEVSEKIRLFYVATTRAKEKMIFLLPEKETNEEYSTDGLVDLSLRTAYRSFADILYSIYSKIQDYVQKIDLKTLSLTKDYNLVNNYNLFSGLNKNGAKIEVIDYPKLEIIQKEEKHFSKSSLKLITKEEQEIMDFGSKIHYYLENLDLVNPLLTNLDEIMKDKIKKFLASDLVLNIKKAKIYQEYEFMYEEDNDIMHGIIDLMLEYDDYIDIIDYKLKNIDDVAYEKQLNGYRKYIMSMKKKQVNLYLYSIMDEKYKKIA